MSIDVDDPTCATYLPAATVTPSAKEVFVEPDPDFEVSGYKREYAIVGDGLFASRTTDRAPQWLVDIIDLTIGSALTNGLSDLGQAYHQLSAAIDAIDVANNNYAEMINIDATVDSAIASHLVTLNSRIDTANATIIDLNTTKVSATEAAAISLNAVRASLEADGVGTIGGEIIRLDSSVNSLAGSVTSTRLLVESRYGELNSALAGLTIEVETGLANVSTMLSYDSLIKIGDDTYRSGFGLNADYRVPSLEEPGVYTSEFWVDATKLRFTNSEATGRSAPFTIDATGETPVVKFNGLVEFSNVSNVPQLGSTPEEVVAAINDGTTTTINGGRITTGTIAAGSIAAGTITAAVTLNAANIVGGSMNINNRFIVSSAGNVTIRSATSGQRTEMSNTGGRVYDSSGRLRVRWGIW